MKDMWLFIGLMAFLASPLIILIVIEVIRKVLRTRNKYSKKVLSSEGVDITSHNNDVNTSSGKYVAIKCPQCSAVLALASNYCNSCGLDIREAFLKRTVIIPIYSDIQPAINGTKMSGK